MTKETLVVDQRVTFVDGSAALHEPAAGVEPTGPGLRVIGIEANGVGRPIFRDGACIFERQASQPLPLMCHRDRHPSQVQRSLHRREIRDIDGPRLLRRKPKHRQNAFAIPPNANTRVVLGERGSPLTDQRGPMTWPIARSERTRGGVL